MLLAGRCFRLAQKEQGKEEARGEANVKKNFDKYLLFSNIRELLKNSDVKIGEIEKQAGCYPGYMSRLDKKDNTTEPSVEFVMTAAKLLKTSVDVITRCDLAALNPTELYLKKFFEKLEKDTIQDKLDWEILKASYLNNLKEGIVINGTPSLFQFTEYSEFEQNPIKVRRVLFPSNTFGVQTYIAGNCYFLRMKNSSYLYLMEVGEVFQTEGETGRRAKEIWITTTGVLPTFLASNTNNSKLESVVDSLFAAAKNQMNYPQLDRKFKNVIEDYLKGHI